MMKFRFVIALLLGGVVLSVLAGCYGSSPVLNPQLTFTLPALPEDPNTPYVPLIPANGILVTKGSISNTGVADNVISRKQWTQKTTVAGAPLGHFYVTDNIETSWLAPDWHGPEALPITLTFEVETSMGGYAKQSFNVLVVPAP